MVLSMVVATAKVVLAFVCVGREVGLREAGVQAVDLLAVRGRRTSSVVKQALAAIETELDSVVTADGIDPQLLEPVLQTVQDLFSEHALTTDELAAAGLDHTQAATELLRRGQRLLATQLSEQEQYLVERATLGCYRAILSQPELLPGRDHAFQRHVLADLTDLKKQSEELPDRLVKAITAFLQQKPEAEWPVVVGRVPTVADQYQPRRELRRVLDAAAPGITLVLAQERSGPGGVGKTQLAAAYARDQLGAGAVDLLVWVTATSRDAILTAYITALGKVQPHRTSSGDTELDAGEWLAWLADTGKRWLVVLDDVADPQDLRGLWPSGPAGRVLITTRRRDHVFTEHGRQRIQVGLFTEAESLNYLTGKLEPDQLDQATELAAELGHIPLALAQAASVIADNQSSCAAYRRRLADQSNRLESLFPPEALADDYTRTVATTWLASVEAADRLSPRGLASRLLRLAALLDPNGIPADLFTTPAVLQYLPSSNQDEHGPGSSTSSSQSESGQGGDTADALRAEDVKTGLQNLRRVSLADIDAAPDADLTGGLVRVHDLVQWASRDTTGPNLLATNARVCAAALLQLWPRQDYQPALALRTASLRSNTANLYRQAGKDLWQPAAHPVLFRPGHSLQDGGSHTLAVDYWNWLHSQATVRLQPRHPHLLAMRNNLAAACQAAGRFAEAILLLEQTLTECITELGERHPDTLTSRNNLAIAYRDAGRLTEAIPLLEQTLTECITGLGERHPDTLNSRNNLAAAYLDVGRLTEAIPLLEQTLTDRIAAFGERHPKTLMSRNNLATAYRDAGRLTEAIPLLEQTVTDRSAELGERHPDTLTSRNNLATTYLDAGRLTEAIPLLEQTLTDSVTELGGRHPNTLMSRNNLATAYLDAGRLTEAIPLLEQTLTDFTAGLGGRHPATLMGRNNLAAAYHAVGRLTEAIPLLEQTLTDYTAELGESHPNTLTSRNNLATAYRDAGRLTEALSLLEPTLTDSTTQPDERLP